MTLPIRNLGPGFARTEEGSDPVLLSACDPARGLGQAASQDPEQGGGRQAGSPFQPGGGLPVDLFAVVVVAVAEMSQVCVEHMAVFKEATVCAIEREPIAFEDLAVIAAALRLEAEEVRHGVSIDPDADTPEVLARYRKRFDQPWTGWYHLTGDYYEIESLRWILGVYDLDPVIDANKTEHAGIVTFGNDKTNWWSGIPALTDPVLVSDSIIRIAGNPVQQPR